MNGFVVMVTLCLASCCCILSSTGRNHGLHLQKKIQNFLQHLAVVLTDVKLSKIFGIYNFICLKICSILGFMHHLMFCIICRIHGVLDENGRTMLSGNL